MVKILYPFSKSQRSDVRGQMFARRARGFTLIEILIVVGIIGLLATVVLSGLGSVRGRGRDARRVADLRQVQQGLELYYTKNQAYPDPGTSGNWADLVSALTGADLGITNVPSDPLYAGTSDDYKYFSEDNQTYVLQVTLEDGNSALLKDSFIDNYGESDCAAGTKHYCVKF